MLVVLGVLHGWVMRSVEGYNSFSDLVVLVHRWMPLMGKHLITLLVLVGVEGIVCSIT